MHDAAAMAGEGDERTTVCVFAPVSTLVATLERTADGEEQLDLHAGGQGVWMARAIVALGGTARLCTPLGGETGAVTEHLLIGEGIDVERVPTSAPSTTWIHDRRDGERRIVWESEPAALSQQEEDELYTQVLAVAVREGICVLAGPHGSEGLFSVDLYRRLGSDLRSGGATVVADVSGQELAELMSSGGVDLLKASGDELVRDGRARDTSDDALWEAMDTLRQAGARRVVVSRAEAPSQAIIDDHEVTIMTPTLEVSDSRGAGDAMTAAFALGLARRQSWDGLLRLGAATASMSVTRRGTSNAALDAVEAMAEQVQLIERRSR